MNSTRIQSVLGFLSLAWLTGPVLGKELRVVSRRRRHYLFRCAYLALLSVFVVITWVSVVEIHEGSAASVYKMSDAGKTIIVTISWFQFLALQLIAVILMSTSISEEVRCGTLAVLMTTPITSLQIVAGKLLSKLLHLTILLLISLPLLAIVRVFGGVPWSYVIASGCITLTAVAFAGATAMFFSAIFRRAYASILLTLAAGFGFHLLIPWIFGMILSILSLVSGMEIFTSIFLHINPFYAMGLCTFDLFQPGSFPLPFFWPLHCVIMLGFTGGLLVPCIFLVRKAALRSAIGSARSAPNRLVRVALPPPATGPMQPETVGATTP
ncbi:MAG: ABC transporter permease subunit, partial [Phycisphaerae bacterium]|nr:ABC transporter permease subunit [Phycisphaerae bacterium]